MKPLFIPLRREYFEAFERRIKRLEIRRYGPRWNERTCQRGRKVTLCCGYSGARLKGTIKSFTRSASASKAARAIYPGCNDFALIEIKVG